MSKNKQIILFILITLLSSVSSIDNEIPQELIKLIESQLIHEIEPKNITVYTGKNWQYLMLQSVSKYLFEDIDIVENLAPKGQVNRPGYIYDKHYICVHDTGDHSLGAHQWSDVVKHAKIGTRDYNMSFQYVVGNDGYYHNIPDNEIAFHAGDGHFNESIFGLNASGVYTNEYTKERPKIEIDEEGYYLINGQKSSILAPKNGSQILKNKDINDLGIYSELIKEENEEKYQYYLGRTWFNPIWDKISNYGGNLNSIGIESCINHDTDVYYTWQKVAKLVAKLMDENNLDINAVVQHHYFSGKNCPQTMRTAKLWEFYKTMISAEYEIRKYIKQGYSFEFKSDSEFLNDKGRVIKVPKQITTVNYQITIKDKDGNSVTHNYNSKIIIDNGKDSDTDSDSDSDIDNNTKYIQISLIGILILFLCI